MTSLQLPSCAGLPPRGSRGTAAKAGEVSRNGSGGGGTERVRVGPGRGSALTAALLCPLVRPASIARAGAGPTAPLGRLVGRTEAAWRPHTCHPGTGAQAALPVARPQWSPWGRGPRPVSGSRADLAGGERGCAVRRAGGPRCPGLRRGGGDLLGPGPKRLQRASSLHPPRLPQWRKRRRRPLQFAQMPLKSAPVLPSHACGTSRAQAERPAPGSPGAAALQLPPRWRAPQPHSEGQRCPSSCWRGTRRVMNVPF